MGDPTASSGALLTLDQLEEFLIGISPELYTCQLPILEGQTLGQHVRHILEFYDCLLKGLASGKIDYASRQRSQRPEVSVDYALELTGRIRMALAGLHPAHPVLVNADFADGPHECHSSVGRELMFAFDHAVHHLAIIRIAILQSFPEYKLPANFGIAPSTVRYKKHVE